MSSRPASLKQYAPGQAGIHESLNPNTWEMAVRGPGIQSHLLLLSELETSLKPCLKTDR